MLATVDLPERYSDDLSGDLVLDAGDEIILQFVYLIWGGLA